eukprot:CAMPEP_0113708064 /NCGR_PEP_ID=MMETSP0038_2-20120614/28758_1 /TAXON_ID=2898 /ORGANISM="Cryptomonas paramecium" /LENGTH=257 /DNA_ID=CAMNT_0000633697 /DNA_START=85 /DNA_END=855 /DNA_ORIENTATION=- /assembly_acc=CAM_ASM_000170
MSLLHAEPLDFKSTWLRLEKTVTILVTSQFRGLSSEEFMQMHTLVYKLCTIPQGREYRPLSPELYFELRTHLKRICSQFAAEFLASPDILHLYTRSWATFNVGSECINGIFAYMNRFYLRDHCADGMVPVDGVCATVYDMCIEVWKEVVQCDAVAAGMLDALLDEVTDGREGGLVDYGLIKQVLHIYQELGVRANGSLVYNADFSVPFVLHTYRFYAEEAEALIAESQGRGVLVSSLQKMHARINGEILSASRYLSP